MISPNAFNSQIGHPLHIIKTLGEGTHGKVFLARDTLSGAEVAIKSIKKKLLTNEQEKKHVRQEIEIMSKLHHPHIISVHRVFETDSEVVLVLEYANGGELFDYINSFASVEEDYDNVNVGGLPEAEAKKVFRQLVSAIQYLHEKKIVHRDLKLENVLLDSKNNAKVADFGLSAVCVEGQLLKTYCGSPLYASPEIVNGRPYHGPEVDCWSLGVLLYAMVYGTMPFDGHDFKTLRRQITQGLVQQPPILSGAHGLILSILNPVLSRRATLADIADHQWLREDVDETPSVANRYRSCKNEQQLSPSKNFDDEERALDLDESVQFYYASKGVEHSNCPPELMLMNHGSDAVISAFQSKPECCCLTSMTDSEAAIGNHRTCSTEGTLSDLCIDSSFPSKVSSPYQVDGVDDAGKRLSAASIGLSPSPGSTCDGGQNGNRCSSRHESEVTPRSNPLVCSRSLIGDRYKSFSADSLDRRGVLVRRADGIDEFGSWSSDINRKENGHSSDDEEHSGCSYDFADINAVLDEVIADPDRVGVEDNDSILSCDSLD